MAKYAVSKTISYDLYAEVEAETERHVFDMLDDNSIEFERSLSDDERTYVELLEDKE